jgi:hypothetical protein
MEPVTKVQRRFVNRVSDDVGPEVEMIAPRAALEALKGVLGQID